MNKLQEILSKIKALEEQKSLHKKGVKKTLEVIRHLEKEENEERAFEFFFYAPTQKKAKALANHLDTALGYEVYGINKSNYSGEWLVTGRTPTLVLSSKALGSWSDAMDELAYVFESKFDGWGTLI